MNRNPAPRERLTLRLTVSPPDRYTRYMAQTYLIFDFGADEETAQKARHRIDGWKQAFHLDRKMLVRFEREAPEPADTSKTDGKAAEKSKKTAETADAAKSGAGQVRVLVRLDFSDHEKLSHQRWLDRIPADEAFKAAKHEVIGHGDASFEAVAKRFEELESQPTPPRAR
jgi:hypothetical protein